MMHKNIGILEYNINVLEKSYQGGNIDIDVINQALKEMKDVVKQWKNCAIIVHTPEDIMYRAKDRKVFVPHSVAIDICNSIQKTLKRVTLSWEAIDVYTDAVLQQWSENRGD